MLRSPPNDLPGEESYRSKYKLSPRDGGKDNATDKVDPYIAAKQHSPGEEKEQVRATIQSKAYDSDLNCGSNLTDPSQKILSTRNLYPRQDTDGDSKNTRG